MVDARELGEKITRMFNFIYEVKDDYYVLGRDYVRICRLVFIIDILDSKAY